MSSPDYANTPAGFLLAPPVTFIAANTTVAKILVEAMPAAAASGAIPKTYGGGTVIDITAASTDAADKIVQLFQGTVATIVGASTGAVTTTTSTIPRASGSFISDGWLVGDIAMTFAPTAFCAQLGVAPNAAVDGISTIVTAVTALGLTLNGTPIAALALATGTRICRMKPHTKVTVPANCGTSVGIPSVNLVNSVTDGSIIRSELKLGSNNILAVAMVAAVAALPATISVGAVVANY